MFLPSNPLLSTPVSLIVEHKPLMTTYHNNFYILLSLGELIGVDYLLSQTGQPLQRVNPDAEETHQLLEDVNVEELEDEGFEEDLSDDPTMTLLYEDLTIMGDRDASTASSVHPAAASSDVFTGQPDVSAPDSPTQMSERDLVCQM